MRRLSLLNSLSRRIRLGYGLMVTLVALIMLLVGLGLADIRQRVSALEAVSALSDTVLEIRRYEKNWLLYRQEQDFFENRMQLEKALALLVEQERRQVAASLQRMQEELKSGLLLYRELINKDFSFFQVAQRHAEEEQIRSVGKRLVDLSGAMNESIRSSIDGKLALLKTAGFLFVLAVAGVALFLGRQMTNLIVQPLQHIVDYTRCIAAGNFTCWEDDSDPFEIQAVSKAICHMMAVLEKREKQLIQAEKLAAVGTLVAGVAHELNNPLSNASTSAQILLEELQELNTPEDDFLVEMAVQIDEETDRARNIIRSLLEFCQCREIRPKEIELGLFLQDTVKLVRGDIPSAVEFTTEIAEDGLLFADKQQLQQALINILRNAAQAVDAQTGQIFLKAGIEPDNKQVLIEVRDNGPGIAAVDLEKIFDPFYTTKDVGKGSGLGLAITHEIIEKHGGEITVESKEGHGATFLIRLPVEID